MTNLTIPLLATTVGFLIGPVMLDLASISGGNTTTHAVLEHVAAATLALSLMEIGLRLPSTFLRAQKGAVFGLLFLAMAGMWLSSTGIIYLLIPLDFWLAALIGAVITPTDPVIASSVVTGPVAQRFIPERVRHAISAESGFNDRLSLPFVGMALLLYIRPWQSALVEWSGTFVLLDVGGAILGGILFGYLAAELLRVAEEHRTISKSFTLL